MSTAFLEHELRRRIPASYIRFLWFMGVIGVALVALLAGQGYASVFLSTLPHTGLDGTAYVLFWTVNVNILMLVSIWILEEKVRSRALVFVMKYYYFLVSYHIKMFFSIHELIHLRSILCKPLVYSTCFKH